MNEDQKAILETVTRFVEDEVKPRAAKLDADPDPAAGFSWEIVEKAHEVGIRSMTLSEKWGGLGTDSLTHRDGDRGARERRHRRLGHLRADAQDRADHGESVQPRAAG